MRKTSHLLIFLVLTATGIAWGDCVDGVRPSSAAENAFHVKLQQALIDVFPEAPEGFKQPPAYKPDERPLSMCKGQAIGDFSVRLQKVYERSTRVSERDTPEYAKAAEFDTKLQELAKLTPEAQARYDAAKKEYDAVNAPYRAAVKANNKEESTRMRKDVDAAYAKMRQVEEDHRRAMLPKSQALVEEREKVRTQIRDKYYAPVTVIIRANSSSAKQESKGWTLGSFSKPALKLQKIVYEFQGPDAEVEKFMAKVDQAKLKALIGLQ